MKNAGRRARPDVLDQNAVSDPDVMSRGRDAP
jgi:hypothetical protein